MAIFSDLELEGILNEAEDERKYKDKVKDNIQDIKDTVKKAKDNAKNNSWIGKKMSSKNESGMQTITFKEDADGNVLESSLDEGTRESRFEVKFGDDGKNKKETVLDKVEEVATIKNDVQIVLKKSDIRYKRLNVCCI